MRNLRFAPLIAAATLLPAAAAVPAEQSVQDQKMLGPMAGLMLDRVGEWNVTANLHLQPAARPITIAAVATSKLIGNRWLVTEMRGAAAGKGMPMFEGLGVNGFDPGAGRYVGYWVDGTRGIAIPVTGTFDSRTGIFATSSVEHNPDGTVTKVRSETKRTGPDSEVTTFTATDSRGRSRVRMVLAFKRVAPKSI